MTDLTHFGIVVMLGAGTVLIVGAWHAPRRWQSLLCDVGAVILYSIAIKLLVWGLNQ